MIKRILSLVVFLFLTIIQSTRAQEISNTLLWKVTKPGNTSQSYLFGTFHEVSPMFFDSLKPAIVALENSAILFVEQKKHDTSQNIRLKESSWNVETWQSSMLPDQQQIFSDFVKRAGDSVYYRLDPLLLLLTTSRLYLLNYCQSAFPVSELMDHHIESLASSQKKLIYSLDENQETMFRNQSFKQTSTQDSMQISYCIQMMSNMLTENTKDCQIVNDYRSFNLDYHFNEDISDKTSTSLLTERNKKWVAKLLEQIPKHNCFVAVGFRHLFYQNGIIQQLRNLGYIVMPITLR